MDAPRSPDVAIVVGTRPEIIKMAPVIRAARRADDVEFLLVHTNQHYDEGMSDVFFENLKLPAPDANLDIGSGSQGEQTANGIVGVEDLLVEHEPAVVLAQGDTNAVLSTAIAASKLPVTFGHVEAGIRSFDWSMPEEINRIVADRVSNVCFAPTDDAAACLADEGIDEGVFVTGNTIVDACREHLRIAEAESSVLADLGLSADEYVAATIHRPRNTDDHDRLERIVDALDGCDVPAVLPAHPRTRQELSAIDFEPTGNLQIVDPLDYPDFLKLEANARVIVTDSGGIQEEASILEVPCLTVRPNTERPETIEAGVNELVEPDALADRLGRLIEDADLRESMRGHPDLYGDGRSGERILTILTERYLH